MKASPRLQKRGNGSRKKKTQARPTTSTKSKRKAKDKVPRGDRDTTFLPTSTAEQYAAYQEELKKIHDESSRP